MRRSPVRIPVLVLVTSLALTLGVTPSSAETHGSFSGRMVDEDERPVAGIQVWLRCDNEEPAPADRFVTGRDGRFDLTATRRACEVMVRDPDARVATFDRVQRVRETPGVPVAAREGEPRGQGLELGDVQLRRPVSVSGRIVDAEGRPYDFVSMRLLGSFDNASYLGDVAADGTFTFDDEVLFTDHYALVASVTRDGVSSDLLDVPAFRQRLVPPGGRFDSGTVKVDPPQPRPQGRVRVAGGEDEVTLQSVDGRSKGYSRVRDQPVDVGRYRYAWTDLSQDSTVWGGGGSFRGAPIVEVRRGRTLTIPASPRTQRVSILPVDPSGQPPDGLSIVVRSADEPTEVLLARTSGGTYPYDLATRFGPVTVTISDPSGRYPTVRRSRFTRDPVELGPSRNGVPARPEPSRRGPEPPGQLSVGLDLGRHDGTGLIVQYFDADDGDRLVHTQGWPGGASVPKGHYKVRVVDPTGRVGGVWVGGGTSLATAATHRPYLGYDRMLTARLVERFVPVVAPRITGRRTVGGTLAATRGGWNGAPTRFRHQWFRGTRAISGADEPRYRLRAADAGRSITVRVVASKGTARQSVRSRAVVISRR